MKVLGLDPGLRTSGYAVVEDGPAKLVVVEAGTITAEVKLPLAERLSSLRRDFDELLDEHVPELIAVEELYSHYNHPRTAILMGHARGVFLVTAAERGIEVCGFAATRVKKCLTGRGRASKEQVQRAVMSQLGLAQAPEPADVSDALALAMCCINEQSREKLQL